LVEDPRRGPKILRGAPRSRGYRAECFKARIEPRVKGVNMPVKGESTVKVYAKEL